MAVDGHARRRLRRAVGLEHTNQPAAESFLDEEGHLPSRRVSTVATVDWLTRPEALGRGATAMRGAVMREAQQTLGNRAVQRIVQRDPSLVLLDDKQLILRKPEVPGLSKAAETTAKPLLGGSAADKQKAIDAVVKNIVRKGEMSLGKIDGKQVVYNSATAGEGLTTTTFSGGKPGLSKVEMGDAAFASLGWLYSSILHEYKHVQQHQALKDTSKWDEDVAEVEAYAREIKKAKATGVSGNKTQMEELWTRLHDNYWVNITDAKKKKKLLSLVKACHKIAEKATGKKLTLTP